MILFLSDVTLFNPASGAEQVLYQQARGLAQNGHQICAITRSSRNSANIKILRKKGIQELRYHADPQNTLPFILQLLRRPQLLYRQLENRNDITIIICHQPFTLISLLINGKIRKIPILYLFISPSHQEYLIDHKNNNRAVRTVHATLRRMIERICLRNAVKIMYLSKYMKQQAIKIHGVSEKSLVYNPAGVDLERFKPIKNRTIIKKELFFPSNKFHLLTVRNLEHRMGLDNLIIAVNLLRIRQISMYLIIGGEGPVRKNLHNLIDKLNLKNDVKLTGFIPDEKLAKYYCAADFFILPTRELEGFGLVTIESMACGTPVLGTPVGATTEILSDFDSRMLFKNASPEAMAEGIQTAIENYSPDEIAYRKLRTRCREHVQLKYSWQRHIKRLQSAIDGIAQQKELQFSDQQNNPAPARSRGIPHNAGSAGGR